MFDLLLALLGRRTCPWCHLSRRTPVQDWLADHLPYRAYAGLRVGGWDYNEWVGRTAIPIHQKHTEAA
jgi:hypothetical protein